MNEKHNILCFWILTHGTCNCNNSFNFWIFSKFQVQVERELIKLHFLNLRQIPQMVILKVRIKVDQGTFFFRMHGLLGVNPPHICICIPPYVCIFFLAS